MKNNRLNPDIWQEDLPEMNDNLMWSRIEKEMDKSKSKPVFFYWIYAAILLITLGLTYTLINGNNRYNSNNYKNIVKINTKIEENENNAVLINTNIKNNKQQKSKSIGSDKFLKKDDIRTNKVFEKKVSQEEIIFNSPVSKTNDNNRSLHPSHSIPIRKYFVIQADKIRKISLGPTGNITSITDKTKTDQSLFVIGLSGLGYSISNTEYDKNVPWQYRKFQKERDLYNYSFSIKIAKPIYKNIFVSLGVNYQNKITNFRDKETTIKLEYFQSDSAYVIRNTSTYLSGERTKTTTTTKKYSYYNRTSEWSIPFGLGYIWTNKNNSLILNAGMQFRFNSRFSGYTVSPGNEIKKYESFHNSINKHLGLSQVDLSALYSRKLTSNIEILLGLQGVLPLSPDYSIDTYISKSQFLRVVTGLKYKL